MNTYFADSYFSAVYFGNPKVSATCRLVCFVPENGPLSAVSLAEMLNKSIS
jgi:hypothetical protein